MKKSPSERTAIFKSDEEAQRTMGGIFDSLDPDHAEAIKTVFTKLREFLDEEPDGAQKAIEELDLLIECVTGEQEAISRNRAEAPASNRDPLFDLLMLPGDAAFTNAELHETVQLIGSNVEEVSFYSLHRLLLLLSEIAAKVEGGNERLQNVLEVARRQAFFFSPHNLRRWGDYEKQLRQGAIEPPYDKGGER